MRRWVHFVSHENIETWIVVGKNSSRGRAFQNYARNLVPFGRKKYIQQSSARLKRQWQELVVRAYVVDTGQVRWRFWKPLRTVGPTCSSRSEQSHPGERNNG